MFSCNFSQLIIFPPLFAPIFHLCFIKVEFETPYLYVLGPFIDDITYGNLDHVLAGLLHIPYYFYLSLVLSPLYGIESNYHESK